MNEHKITGHLNKISAMDVFWSGFFVLFLEMICLRWFASFTTFMQFFTNSILLGCFLGMSLGCLQAAGSKQYLTSFPRQLCWSLGLTVLSTILFHWWKAAWIDVGNQSSPEVVFFGTEYKAPDLAHYVIPIEVMASIFFVVVTLLFLAPGQIMGQCFDGYPNRLKAYALNITGSLAGIVAFTISSLLCLPPIAWLIVVSLMAVRFLKRLGSLTLMHKAYLMAAIVLTIPFSFQLSSVVNAFWSPYYMISYFLQERVITVDSIGHQTMLPWNSATSRYSLIHSLQAQSGREPFKRVLIIGAGSGNDVAHALKAGAQEVTAVEIDPIISSLGKKYHPDSPYQDKRVTLINDDGRHFLRTTDRKYDLVIYALVDSLVLRSSFSSIRLESFLFTSEAFREIRRVLAPNGIFVSYNYFRQGFVVDRIASMMSEVFGQSPLIVTFPFIDTIVRSKQADAFSVIVTGAIAPYQKLFEDGKKLKFWSETSDNFNSTKISSDSFTTITPTRLESTAGPAIMATDDWPFLYTREPSIPWLYLRSAMGIILITILLIIIFRPKGGEFSATSASMFWMGAGFMLLESDAIVRLSVRYGSTWVVNSAVFSGILLLILLANFAIIKFGKIAPIPSFLLVILSLIMNFVVSWEGQPTLIVTIATLLPMLFAGLAFSALFSSSQNPHNDMAANIFGAILGGLLEYSSMMTGFRGVIPIIAFCYVLAAVSSYFRKPAMVNNAVVQEN